VPVDIHGERSRSIAGDASSYSVIDEPAPVRG
jgi:alpha-ketoglutarate-dependent sulfate ester dioxygenase